MGDVQPWRLATNRAESIEDDNDDVEYTVISIHRRHYLHVVSGLIEHDKIQDILATFIDQAEELWESDPT